jgi:RND superfamily putative drug exporter
MFFPILGRFIRRAWAFLLVGWIILLLAARFAAPRLEDIAQDKEFAFLPADMPSVRAGEMFDKAFPNNRLSSTIVLVLHRDPSTKGQLSRDLKFIDDSLEPGLRAIAQLEGGLAGELNADEPLFSDEDQASAKPEKRSIIARIHTPNAPGAGALLISPDHRALLVVLDLTTEFLSTENWPTIDRVKDLVSDLREQGKIPPGVEIALTGSAVIGRDHTRAQLQSVHSTEVLTMVLVIGLLIAIYRAPLLALIPLLTVWIGVQLSLHLLAILGRMGYMTLFQGIQIYIVILSYGAGVDYCLFLIARYREELARGRAPDEAVERAVAGVGAALTASAATVMCGIAMMMFAGFGKFREAGFAIPLSLLVVLVATLSFSPSLLRLAGRWAFWPYRPEPATRQAPGAPQAAWWRRFFQVSLLERLWVHVGEMLLRRAGTAWLVTVAVMAPFVIAAGLLYNHLSYNVIGNLPEDSISVAGTCVLEKHFPPGVMGPLTALLINRDVDFGGPEGANLVRQITDRLNERRDDLGLAEIRSLTAPLGAASGINPFAGLNIPRETQREAVERAALDYYVTDLGERAKVGTRMDLILAQSPFSAQSIQDLDRIEEAVADALPESLRQNTQLYFAGMTASVRDLGVVTGHDRKGIERLVLLSVFLILILLLRQFLVPLYLLLSVLFSYYATLGVSFALFWLLDPHGFTGIDWKVAIFLFTILIAVGEDYNIFLMTRIGEEEREHGPVHGVTEALDRTGPIISSCGIIMAGTFASLLAGSLTEMKQLGFALSFGVLLDTFVVRPVLLPAFLILLREGRLPLARWIGHGKQVPAAVSTCKSEAAAVGARNEHAAS